MPTPSLILVPARFKTGKLYTPLATTSGGVVLGASGDFNVTRATTATRVNASGFIEVVASGVPRLDYYTSGGTAGCPALLVEPAGTNLAWHSETWASGTNWGITSLTIATGTNATLDPFGTNTANAISPTNASGVHELFSNNTTAITYTSGTIYTQSAFFKQGTGSAGRYVQLTFPSNRFTQAGYANFDLQLGTLATVSGTTADSNRSASIENYGNGWYRCRFTATCNASSTAGGVVTVLITASGDTRRPSFTGVTGDVLYGFGAQLETGSVATSYIPTTTTSATRNAEVISLSGAISGCIGQTEGTIYAEVDLRNIVGTKAIIALTDGTTDNRIVMRFTSSTVLATIIRVAGATNDYSVTIPTIPSTGGIYKIAFAYKANDYCLALNGTTYASTATRAVPATNSMAICQNGFGTDFLNDRIRAVALYTTRLTDAQLAALTT